MFFFSFTKIAWRNLPLWFARDWFRQVNNVQRLLGEERKEKKRKKCCCCRGIAVAGYSSSNHSAAAAALLVLPTIGLQRSKGDLSCNRGKAPDEKIGGTVEEKETNERKEKKDGIDVRLAFRSVNLLCRSSCFLTAGTNFDCFGALRQAQTMSSSG